VSARGTVERPPLLGGGRSDEIVAAGARFHVGAPVVLWSDPGGYDASVQGPVFAASGPAGPRYGPGRSWAADPASIGLAELRDHVDLLVLHYDICGISRETFRMLQDERVLSSHFLLDVDGTIYQTLDLRDQAWHGRFTNPRSIGIEIANVGVVSPDPADDPFRKRRWYVRDGDRLRLEIPADLGDPHLREPGPFYSSRSQPIRGAIHGKEWEQFDFTPEQYRSLALLTVALRRAFPRIALDAPRGADGAVRTGQLSREEIDAFRGILGHLHVTTERNEPGPAFQWERYLDDVRAIEAAGAGGSR